MSLFYDRNSGTLHLRYYWNVTLTACNGPGFNREILKKNLDSCCHKNSDTGKMQNHVKSDKDQNIFFFHIRRPRQSEIITEIPKIVSNANGVFESGIPTTFIP